MLCVCVVRRGHGVSGPGKTKLVGVLHHRLREVPGEYEWGKMWESLGQTHQEIINVTAQSRREGENLIGMSTSRGESSEPGSVIHLGSVSVSCFCMPPAVNLNGQVSRAS